MEQHHSDPRLRRTSYTIPLDEQRALLAALDSKTDPQSLRIKRYVSMADLSRTEGSPLYAIIQSVLNLPTFSQFDVVTIPEVVPADVSFDLFNFAPDHPARSESDTYYVAENAILRTHDTVMWYYYLNLPEVKARIAAREPLGVICYGKVYRKDEIDRHHMNIFHQMGGLYLVPDDEPLVFDDLKAVLVTIAQAQFGADVVYRFNEDTFPYTDPSLEMEVQINGKWIEVLGGGMPRAEVLSNFGVTGYHGWAFGFGLERLAIISMELPDIRLLWSTDSRVTKQLVLGQKFVEVSKYPPVIRDISFVVPKTFVPNNYFDAIRDINEELVEEVEQLDCYENDEKFGAGNISYAYRITYRHPDRTLTNEEVDVLHKQIEDKTVAEFGAQIR